MNINEYVPAFEAVIFANGEPIHIDRLTDVFNIDKSTALKILKVLSDRLDDSHSGVKLLRLGDSYQLCTRTEYSEYIRNSMNLNRNTPLSQAAFEVLAVIAYNQPVTRAFVEQVRGVDCSGVISTLTEKELIEEKGRLELPGRPLLYGTTDVFLRCFGLSSLDELPPLPVDENGETSNSQPLNL